MGYDGGVLEIQIVTWNQILRRIEKMTPEQRKRPAYFCESYDEDRAITEACVDTAAEDLYDDESDDPIVAAGEPYLTS